MRDQELQEVCALGCVEMVRALQKVTDNHKTRIPLKDIIDISFECCIANLASLIAMYAHTPIQAEKLLDNVKKDLELGVIQAMENKDKL